MEHESKAVTFGKDKNQKKFMKRTIQDSVFTNLFRDKKYLIQLYRALHPEDTTTTEDDIVTVTIQNILTDNPYNDLGILIGDLLLILVEAQSTWSVNIIIRALMYLMQTYNEYFMERKVNLYSSTKIKMPKPELYVIFTGEHSEKPEYISLSKEFFDGQECGMDAKVKVIYHGIEGDIINQYIIFTKVCKEQVALYGRTRKAVLETIRICKNRNILKEYLENKEKEVVDIMVTLYDEQEIMDRYIESTVKEAVEKAVEKAVKEAVKKAVAQTMEKAAVQTKEVEKETSVRSAIEMCQDLGLSLDNTIDKIVLKFNLDQVEAETKVREYWKQVTE